MEVLRRYMCPLANSIIMHYYTYLIIQSEIDTHWNTTPLHSQLRLHAHTHAHTHTRTHTHTHAHTHVRARTHPHSTHTCARTHTPPHSTHTRTTTTPHTNNTHTHTHASPHHPLHTHTHTHTHTRVACTWIASENSPLPPSGSPKTKQKIIIIMMTTANQVPELLSQQMEWMNVKCYWVCGQPNWFSPVRPQYTQSQCQHIAPYIRFGGVVELCRRLWLFVGVRQREKTKGVYSLATSEFRSCAKVEVAILGFPS